jgi:hypothetical protein
MSALKSWLFPAVVVVAVAAAAAAGGVWASGTGSSGAQGRAAVTSCSSAPIPPANAEVNTVLDKEHWTLSYSFYDAAKAANTGATIGYKDALCLGAPALKRLIEHVLATDAEAQAQTCASIREHVAANLDTIRGVKINLDAARQYISEWC